MLDDFCAVLKIQAFMTSQLHENPNRAID